MYKIERIQMRKNWNKNPLKDLNVNNIGVGFVSGLLAVTGAPALILEAAANGSFTTVQTILWMFSVYVFGGIFSILIPLYYRIPIVGAHSITGVAFLATVTAHFTYQELIGAYILSGVLIFIVGYLGMFSKLLHYVPKEIIAAMLAGMIMKYMIDFIGSIQKLPLVGGVAVISYFIFSKWNLKIPPIIASIVIAFVFLQLTEPINLSSFSSPFVLPTIQSPDFNLISFLSVALPLALLILSNDAAVGIGAIRQNGYHPPMNSIVTLSGIFSIITSFFGGQSANIGGMMSAICSGEEAGPKEKRYMAAVISGAILLLFGLFSWKLVPVIQAFPREFIALVVGLALLGVFSNSLHTSFANPTIKIGATFSFVIALSNISILNISAPVWSLLIGALIAKYVENYHLPSKEEVVLSRKRKSG
ncbi:benzoate transporter [Anaerobacillus arseniciselenatis]|uniref:Benzoate transporter n=1 Tax=Anaerobacillus arseniciselenatis TaxID=85682 RepID=A0A1S2L6W3_9BACI|nr:benzoate/H(+) symporter BenE family transporter [Anaerobacillus arseniciselenatis]OIJ08208.1 benzoate transporter [Anaerobacillus arseniciselenatis]